MDERARAARREYWRRYRAKHLEEMREYQRQWVKKHPDKVREYQERFWRKKAEEFYGGDAA